MKTLHLLTVLCLLGAAVLAIQFSANRSLREQIEKVSADISKEEGKQSHASSVGHDGSQAAGKGLARTKKETVSDAISRVESFLHSLEGPGGEAAFFSGLPVFLNAIQDLDGNGLEQLYEQLFQGISDGPKRGAAAMVRVILIGLIAEQNPKFGFEVMEDLDPSQRVALFSTLVGKAPEEAMLWLGEAEVDLQERRRLESIVVSRLMTDDPLKAVHVMHELRSGSPADEPGNIVSLPEEYLPELEVAYGADGNEEIQGRIGRMLLSSSLLNKGVAETKKLAERLDIPKHELIEFVSHAHDREGVKRGELLDWMLEKVPSGDQQLNSLIFNAAQQWANSDFNGAAEWIQGIEDSGYKDLAIDGFVRSIKRVAPEAAVEWALEIKSPERSQTLYDEAMGHWMKEDFTAAKAWRDARE